MRKWQVRDAKARFSNLLDASISEGPQIVTRRGVDSAVLISVEEWQRLQQAGRPSLKQLLLADAPRFEIPLPSRGGVRRRNPPVLS